MKKNLAIFDFDGTLTTADSFIRFIYFYRGGVRFVMGMLSLSPFLVLMKLGVLPNWKVKELVMGYFLKGEPLSVFNERASQFANGYIPQIINPKAIAQLQSHLKQGHRVIIISASAENWIKAWSDSLSVELIATHLEHRNNLITGKIKGRNCYGIEKINRLKEYLDISNYSRIYVYGDSRGDKEILAIATDPFYRFF